MKENSYQDRIDEIRTVYNEQINVLDENIYELEQELKKIRDNNARFAQELRKYAEIYGVKVEDLKINPEFTFKVQDENGNIQQLRRMDEETVSSELSKKKQMYDSLKLFRNKEISQVRKEEREEKMQHSNRNSIIEEARKFFTYLDTKTTIGTNYSTLSDDELIAFYKTFYDNRNKPGYSSVWNETMERMRKNDRDVDTFYVSSLVENNKHNGLSEEEAITEAIKQFQEKYPMKDIPEIYEDYIKQEEIFGSQAPEEYIEHSNKNEELQLENKEDYVQNQENKSQTFNNNSTTLLTEGQILAFRNRGFDVPFNKPGQTRLTEEQIRVINSAGISTVDLTEPGFKTVEQLTGIPDPTIQDNKKEKHIIREFVEIPKLSKKVSGVQELTDLTENILSTSQDNLERANSNIHR